MLAQLAWVNGFCPRALIMIGVVRSIWLRTLKSAFLATRWKPNNGRSWLTVFAVFLTGTVGYYGLVLSHGGLRTHESDQRKTDVDSSLSGELKPRLPYSVRSIIPVHVRPHPEVIAKSIKILWPKKGDSLGTLVHGLHAFAFHPELRPAEGASVAELLSVLTNGRDCRDWYGSVNVILPSRYGVRHFTDSKGSVSAQSHGNQALATLAECGVPLSGKVITSDGRSFTVRDLLADAMARIRVRDEIEWTALAIILYNEPSSQWKNRFGEQFHFEDIVKLLIARQVFATSCCGTHVNYALAVLRQRNVDEQFLSPDLSKMVDEVLTLSVQASLSSQTSDGSIACDWYHKLFKNDRYLAILAQVDRNLVDEASTRVAVEQELRANSRQPESPLFSRADGVLCTAHQLEWFFLLPQKMQPSSECFSRAAIFLEKSLADAPDDEITRFMCPYSHAVHVLLLMNGGGADGQLPQS